VAVSAPGALVAGVEGAIDVGHLVRLMGLRNDEANLMKLTLPPESPLVGQRVGDVGLPENAALVTIFRAGSIIVPSPDDVLETGDEILLVANTELVGWAGIDNVHQKL
jgi:trk system potassium uptake protein TrkA